MSYVITEPLNIKIRRFIAKLLKKEDKKVVQFDKEAERAFEASHPWQKGSKTGDGNEGNGNA